MSNDLAILGAGNMAEAIVRGLVRAGTIPADRMIAADPSDARRNLFQSDLHVRIAQDNREAVRGATTILLSVKPQQMADVLAGIAPELKPDALIVSIAAGISTSFIQRHLPGATRKIVRAMPNTPMLVGQGIVALARGSHASDADLASARRLFESAATVIDVSEDQMDAVTALSGSGPAYIFFLVEHMIRAGEEMGLNPAQAKQLATKTALGAATMLASSTDTAQELAP